MTAVLAAVLIAGAARLFGSECVRCTLLRQADAWRWR